MSYGGRIAILPGQPKAEQFSTLVHETAHELLHKTERRTETNKTVRETEVCSSTIAGKLIARKTDCLLTKSEASAAACMAAPRLQECLVAFYF